MLTKQLPRWADLLQVTDERVKVVEGCAVSGLEPIIGFCCKVSANRMYLTVANL
jgi:hypothetical protein